MDRPRYQRIASPVGDLYIAANREAIIALGYARNWPAFRPTLGDAAEASSPLLRECEKQLREYFDGDRKVFELPLSFTGTPFQRKVWNALLTLPWGSTCSYAELAKKVGSPRAWRAVGSANGANPISIIAPCHRVIASDGSLAGYGGGQSVKRTLLRLEGVDIGQAGSRLSPG
ncbi:MAG TPA: methylated-DNA--[protein]-cysteine S-methyltransferase [Gammaproteobacteria bacterium]|nr:methylated-DNA--[protein]-cysteine S-methyltransferase [Gammaproteobacteria bacterium]